MSADSTAHSREHGVAYVLQMFPKYSETFILNELLEHQRQGRSVRVLSLRYPREGRFHGCLASLTEAAEYLQESLWDDLSKLREAAWSALATSSAGVCRSLHPWLARHVTSRDLWQATLLKRWAVRRKVRHVHCHFGGFAASVAALSRMMGGPTFSVTLHAHEIFRENGDSAWLRRIVELSAFVVTVSKFNARYLVENVGAAGDRIRVLYNGIPLDRFGFSRTPRETGTILAVGRLIEKKGFIHLIRACRVLADQGLLTRCDIIGEGREKDCLAEEIRRLKLGSVVRLAGAWPQERVADALARYSAFALPCVRAADGNMDALPTVLLEAMAAGCPVVSTHLSGIPEIVENGESGILVPPGDENALAAALITLLKSPEACRRFAESGRRRVEERFDVQRSVAALGDWLIHAAHERPIGKSAASPSLSSALAPEQLA